nr:MAG TPA: hypothetical protein [Caudoviricetes sp.]
MCCTWLKGSCVSVNSLKMVFSREYLYSSLFKLLSPMLDWF